ncbi:DUF1015 domain-containing protein [Candidatus Woesearchaeota archaeon]|nr:DUF1015 domain-containing protein [Candidatus Woesearchaeota archaeon]
MARKRRSRKGWAGGLGSCEVKLYMVDIFPLHGWTYDRDVVGDFSKVITPPNDVISQGNKEELKRRSELNFVRIILPDEKTGGYGNAARLLEKWASEGVITQDGKKTIYIYSQTCIINEKKVRRTGFFSLLRLEDFGKGVLPHERVLEKDLQDRISLACAVKADVEIPFLLYDDKEMKIDALVESEISDKAPYADFDDDENVRHQLWKVTDEIFIKKIQEQMGKHQCVIADGHHRYTSELRVRGMLKKPWADYGLMCFINSFNDGTVILPTNRVVFGLKDLDTQRILGELGKNFIVEEINSMAELVGRVRTAEIMVDKAANLKNHIFGMYSNAKKKGYLLKLKDGGILKETFPGCTDVYRKLDINILHKVIIEGILGISEEMQKRRANIDFVKGDEETVRKMGCGEIQLAFFVNPPLLREVFLTARAGEVMPQKSTCFYPKVFSGLVIYAMEGGLCGGQAVYSGAK